MKNLNEEIQRSKQLMGVNEGLNLPKRVMVPQRPEDYTLSCDITIKGYTYSDLVDALNECRRHLQSEYRTGMDNNEDSSYFFSVTGEEFFDENNDDDWDGVFQHDENDDD